MVVYMETKINNQQKAAVENMHDGCILCGETGSGKSRTAIAYYEINHPNRDMIIITTAKKRDTKDWYYEAEHLLSKNVNITVDSWNNITKYQDRKDTFFIFDEQRVVGYGTWAKTFIKIAKNNPWILLSATPGDCWMDYVPVFIANGFYKNITEFKHMHVIFKRFSKYPCIDRYVNTKRLVKCRDTILVRMADYRKTIRHDVDILCDYDMVLYKYIQKERKDIETGLPIKNVSELLYKMRKVINSDESREQEVLKLTEKHSAVIIFYNYDYELKILKSIPYKEGTEIAEWNGHKHEECPDGKRWVYLVQYSAGCEGWNCISTNAIIFYSQTYSYKTLEQAKGRIDRMNTTFINLYYYHLISNSKLDAAIRSALRRKKNFNESKFMNKWDQSH